MSQFKPPLKSTPATPDARSQKKTPNLSRRDEDARDAREARAALKEAKTRSTVLWSTLKDELGL